MSAALKKIDSSHLKEVIKDFPLLESFPEHLTEQLAHASEILDLPENTQILQQGQVNEYLYFLISGQIGVYVDGGRVSKLQRRGDLLGEMSLISNKPAGATILSETAVTLLRVDSKFFLNISRPDRDLYHSVLYRIYATVLAEKLEATNQKAKQFEELTIKLTATQEELQEINQNLEGKVEERTAQLEQQNMALQASKNKNEELLNSKKVVFLKLSDLQRKYFNPLKVCLDEIRKQHPDEKSVGEARQVLFEVQHLLEPLVSRYEDESSLHSKRVLLGESNKKQQIIAKMALGGTGVELDLVSTVDEGREKLTTQSYDLVVFDAEMWELGNLAREKDPKAGIVLMTSDQIPSYLPTLKKLNAVPHIVSRDAADRTFTVKNILTTVTKVLSRDFFGLEKYLSWGADVQSQPIFSSKQRPELISEVDQYFEKLGVRRANRDRVKVVLEEMLMNAIYDAPVDEKGTSVYNHMPRTVELMLKPNEQGIVRWATDGMLIAVSVQDPFGSLKGSVILKYLESNYAGEAQDLNATEGKGGAGRGLHQIVENSDLVVFNVDPGKRTEVIALFNVEVKEKEQQNPSFHLFVK